MLSVGDTQTQYIDNDDATFCRQSTSYTGTRAGSVSTAEGHRPLGTVALCRCSLELCLLELRSRVTLGRRLHLARAAAFADARARRRRRRDATAQLLIKRLRRILD